MKNKYSLIFQILFLLVASGSTHILYGRTISNKASKTRKQSFNLRREFNRGETLYQNKHYIAATQIFSKIVKRYPGHEPSLIIYGKSAYKLAKYKDAYSLFSKVPISSLDIMTRYEFGYSAYKVKDWKKSLSLLQTIPQKNPNYDFANYYAGISATKIKKYKLAQKLFKNAVVLPASQHKMKNIYLNHLETVVRLSEQQQLKNESKREQLKLQKEIDDELFRKAKKEAELRAKRNKILENLEKHNTYAGRKSIVNKAKLETNSKSQLQDKFGFSSSESVTKQIKFTFQTGYMKTFKSFKKKNGAFGFQAGLSIEDLTTKGFEESNYIFEDQDDRQRVLSQDPAITHNIYGNLGGSIWAEVPVLDNKWLNIEALSSIKLPQLESTKKSGARGFLIALGGKQGIVDINFTSKYLDLVGDDLTPFHNTITNKISAAISLSSGLSIATNGTYKIYQYLLENQSGPSSSLSASLQVSQSLPLGINAGLFGGYDVLGEYISYAFDDYESISAGGEVSTFKLFANASPLPWIKLSVSQLYKITNWHSYDPEEAAEVWELNTTNYLEELFWSMAFVKRF